MGGPVLGDFDFATTPRTVCAFGEAARLGEHCARAGARRVMLVSDRGVAGAGLLDAPQRAVEAAGMACLPWTEVQADPPQAGIEAAVRAARAFGADLVVGLGGGSPMDTAKLVALLCGRDQPLDAIFGIGLAQGPRLPLIQVPTTAGTGSEVTPIAIVTTPASEKKGVVSPLLFPDLAVLDAELTMGLPPAVTAATGVDAMVHAIEAYTSRHRKNPVSDALATGALRLLAGHIDEAVSANPGRAARQAMLVGAHMAGMAFANAPVAAVHALAYPLGGHFHVPHGLSNALVLTEVLRFNVPAAATAYGELAACLDMAGTGGNCDGARFIEAVAALVARMPMAQRLREVGVTEADLDRLAEDAMKVERLLVNNPRAMTLADARAIYRAVL
ncbi:MULTISPECIES: iron-containing alcohol dehydrogenase [unclassified Roseitalea]|uniref:iron-containing alcohol dehydrogenase n=1 Tax=unclassified Roseitalea TaxID=2639107 RepID=UPI00273FA9D7|nr:MULTISPECIES: iron-containing alcohol dehydrogenase [unclassified Roseitalea]